MRRRQAVNFRIAGKRKTPSPKSTETYITGCRKARRKPRPVGRHGVGGCRAAGEGVISLFVVAVGVSGVASDSIVRAVREFFEKLRGLFSDSVRVFTSD